MSYAEKVHHHTLRKPRIAPTAFIAPHVFLSGDLEIGDRVSIWPFVSIRADISPVTIGACSNVQDGAVIHVSEIFPTRIGEWVTIGHKAVVHACEVGDFCLIGMGAVILDGARIGARSIVGANSTVKAGMEVPPGSLVVGTPARVVRELSPEEQNGLKSWADHYLILSDAYRQNNPVA
jgi:carbonic anhydrase/acetyltransferase-like protein (isoleucine patch superfamily)